jgi:hypothetical protein
MSSRLRVSAALAVLLFPATGSAGEPDPADRLAAAIDRHLAADWQARGIHPAAPADDAEFCRRVYLDLVGRTPKVAETRDFLADPSPRKRAELVEKLLGMPTHANHFAAVTRTAWLPETATSPQFAGAGFQFEN